MFEIQPPTKVTFEVDKEKENKTTLVIEPCAPGFGLTIGNALRRVLLSSLPGAAISAVKIEGVDHEFSALDGIKEDAVEIMLNLKQVRMISHSDEPVRVKLKASGKRAYTVADFEKSDTVEFVNTDMVIAEGTSDKSKFEMEVIIEKGRGYVPVEQKEKKDLEIGMISIDSIFTPIQNVSLTITNARVGRMTNFDKITMEIQTDGTIAAEDAIKICGKTLVDQFVPLAADLMSREDLEARLATNAQLAASATASVVADVASASEGSAAAQPTNLEVSIEELGFSTRTINALHSNDIKTLKELAARSREELESLQGLGGKAMSEIEKALKDNGFEI
jgi:DNA-directed RNA polymerase subunit alpha